MLLTTFLCGCGSKKEHILIYTSVEDYVIADMNARLKEEFPDYDITVEYVSTGNHAAKLIAEGKNTECDISYDLEYGYMEQLAQSGVLANLTSYDQSIYPADTVVSDNYLIQCRVGGAIIVNTELLASKGLTEPTSYEDLLKPEYAGLISMANPKSSGTGYMFYKSLVNAWGEDEALAYFDALTPNILQYTSSGSGPVNALLQGEAAIGLAKSGIQFLHSVIYCYSVFFLIHLYVSSQNHSPCMIASALINTLFSQSSISTSSNSSAKILDTASSSSSSSTNT